MAHDIKITLIGAGSYVFGLRLIADLLAYPELRDSTTISLMDIDRERLKLVTILSKKVIDKFGFKTKIEATTDRREALKDANYVITTFRAGGVEASKLDLEIPAKYGIDQAVGDTLGPGGVFYGLRGISVILDICKDMEELCSDALLINYTNPLAMLCWSVNDYTKINCIGLCHSIPNTAATLAEYIGAPIEEISYLAAGINHMAWFLKFMWRGKDAYPLLREKLNDPTLYTNPEKHPAGNDLVRVEIFKAFGYYVSESSRHLSEYVPYFRKRPELLKRYRLVRACDRIKDLEVRREKMKKRVERILKFLEEERPIQLPLRRSREYCMQIINSLETGEPSLIYGNVKNDGLITNLPYGCIVEVPCFIDKTGIHPCYIGELPPQCAALNRMCISVQELTVKAAIEKSKELVFQALLVDPLTSSILSIDEIRNMVDEMFKAEARYLSGFR